MRQVTFGRRKKSSGTCLKPYRLALLLSLGLAASVIGQAQSIKVTLLGTGTPNPHPERFGPSTLVEAGSEKLLFDVGRGATIRLNQVRVPMRGITSVFITHFHSDHLVGLADLWLIGWLPPNYARRTMPLRIVGPTGLKQITGGMEQTYAIDIGIRVKDEGLDPAAAKFDVTEFAENGVVYEKDGVVVRAFAVDHGELIKPSYGYRIDYAGRSVAISGDTRFDENLIEAAKGVDLLIHEVVAIPEKLFEINPAMKRVEAHHTTAEQVGTVFSRVKPKMAALTHYVLTAGPGIPPISKQDVVKRVRSTYSGPLTAGSDLMTFEVGDSVRVASPDNQ